MDRPAPMFIADEHRAPTLDARGVRIHGRMTAPGAGPAVAGDIVIPIGALLAMTSIIIASEKGADVEVVQAVQSAWLGTGADHGFEGLRAALSSGMLSWEGLRLMMADIAIFASVTAS